MCVAPITELRFAGDVLVTNIKPADIPDVVVNDNDLAMITIVQTKVSDGMLGTKVTFGLPPTSVSRRHHFAVAPMEPQASYRTFTTTPSLAFLISSCWN